MYMYFAQGVIHEGSLAILKKGENGCSQIWCVKPVESMLLGLEVSQSPKIYQLSHRRAVLRHALSKQHQAKRFTAFLLWQIVERF